MSQRKGDEFRVFVSYLEIYNGSGMDLLTEDFSSGALEDLPYVACLLLWAGMNAQRTAAIQTSQAYGGRGWRN